MNKLPPTEKCYYTGTHRYSFRAGQPAEIIGVFMAAPEGADWRPCFYVRYPDGIEDLSPISDMDNYTLTFK